MARIRTIKPEFWTDETIVQLPFEARLLFIGMWNFADDSGALEYSPERIKLQILPAETSCDISGLLDLLSASGLIDYWVNEEGTQAISIRNWDKHQKIDNPSRKTVIREGYRKKNIPNEARIGVAQKYGCRPGGDVEASCYYCGMPGKVHWWSGSNGKPTRWITLSELEFDHFVSEHSGGESSSKNIVLACRECNRGKREFDPHQFFAIKNDLALDTPIEATPLEGKGREGKGEDHLPPTEVGKTGKPVLPPCPIDEIISIYHESCPVNPRFQVRNKTRDAYIRSRWAQFFQEGDFETKDGGLECFRWFFSEKVRPSKFLTGQVNGKGGGKPFLADLEWLMRPSNFAKVIEGKYA